MKTEVTCRAIECDNCKNDTCTCGWITLEQLDGREFVCANYEHLKRNGAKQKGGE